jgi:hypothetical protein
VNHQAWTLKHLTSKLQSFSDSDTVSSLGSRVEALSSLCEVSSSFFVTTSTQKENIGVCLEYDRLGRLVTVRGTAGEHAAHPKVTSFVFGAGTGVRRSTNDKQFMCVCRRQYGVATSLQPASRAQKTREVAIVLRQQYTVESQTTAVQ